MNHLSDFGGKKNTHRFVERVSEILRSAYEQMRKMNGSRMVSVESVGGDGDFTDAAVEFLVASRVFKRVGVIRGENMTTHQLAATSNGLKRTLVIHDSLGK